MSASEAGGSSGTSSAGSDAEEQETTETDAGGATEPPLSPEFTWRSETGTREPCRVRSLLGSRRTRKKLLRDTGSTPLVV